MNQTASQIKPGKVRTRRDFLKFFCGAAVSSSVFMNCGSKSSDSNGPEPPEPQVYGPRSGSGNRFKTAEDQSILVCVNGTDIAAMLSAGIGALGGLARLVSSSQNVLIKPNCNSLDPYPGVSSLSCILAIIREVKKVSSGTISVADQGYVSSSSVYPSMGLDPEVANAGASLLTLNESVRVRGQSFRSEMPDFRVYSEIYNAPIIINTSVLKRHFLADLTCAIKNNVGAVAGPGAASTRSYLHRESPNVQADLAELAGLIRPELNIIDARTILTVSGPFVQDGIPVVVNKLILSGDMVATDRYCAEIMAAHDSFQPGNIGTLLSRAEELGLGTSDLGQVKIIELSV
jgi:uncharacterized protein (DUF362 family)